VFLLLSAASLMTLPVLQSGSLQPSFTAQPNQGADVQVRLVISAAGVPVHCTRTFPNRAAGNADALCSMLQATTRYVPAHDSSGRPIAGVIYIWSHWDHRRWTGSAMPLWDPVDLSLGVNRMPKGFDDGSIFPVALQIDPGGKIESCAVSNASLTSQVADLLCREAAAIKVVPATDERGIAVASVQELAIRLTPQATVDQLAKALQRHCSRR
jgi:hypothetical protein